LRDESADAVFGSRMLDRGSARKGGMPLYKYVGNRVLTATQNWLSQARLSEWHSGYRLYRVATLRRMRFEANHDDFAFDTDIILQLLNAQARILELPIPTFYGDEICRVNGIRYAAQVVVASLHNALHRVGLFQRRAFEPIAAAAPSGRDAKLGYRSSHSEVLSRIAPGSRVLDVGSVPGAFASALADKGAVVSTAHHEFTEVHDSRISSHVVDLGHALGLPLHDVDQVLMLDVVEHLAEPEAFIEGLRYALGDRPRELVLTTPNIAFFVTRLMLLAGQFNYGGSGVLDRTHTRLFTFRTIQSLLRDAGFQVVEITGIPAPFPKAVRNPLVARVLLGVNRALIAIAPRVFSYQILVRATSRPHVDHLLSRTRSSTAELTA
jgi:2-polyprenyl-3-methyl-5-hydroxy-6-metoxy-1,4-benzoquinol methylase